MVQTEGRKIKSSQMHAVLFHFWELENLHCKSFFGVLLHTIFAEDEPKYSEARCSVILIRGDREVLFLESLQY